MICDCALLLLSVAVATSGDEREKRDAAGGGGDGKSPLMLAENMEAEQSEQKLRAKRDLDADEIRELFASQRVPLDDYYTPGILLTFPYTFFIFTLYIQGHRVFNPYSELATFGCFLAAGGGNRPILGILGAL